MQIKKLIEHAGNKLRIIKQKAETLHRKTIIYSVLGISILVFLILVLISLPGSSKKIDALKAIPDDAGIIIEIKKPITFWKECSESSAVWQQLLEFELFSGINRNAIYIDSIVKSNAITAETIDKNPLFISFHANKTAGTSSLFVLPVDKQLKEKETETLVSNSGKKGSIKQRSFEHYTINELYDKKGIASFFYFLSGGIFVGSTNAELIEKSIQQINSGKSVSDLKSFESIYKSAGKNVSANLFINLTNFPKLLSQLSSKEHNATILKLKTFAQWTALDLTIKEQMLLFNGYSSISDTIGSDFLGTFNSQKSHECAIQNIIPASSVFMLCYGYSDFNAWNKNYISYLKNNNEDALRQKNIALVNSQSGLDIEKQLLPCIGNELALVIANPEQKDTAEYYYGIFKTSQLEKTLALLKPEKIQIKSKQEKKISAPKKKGKKGKKTNQKTVTVTKVEELENIYEYKGVDALQALFGKMFGRVSCNYYSIVGDYIVFSNTINALKYFIEQEKNNNTLSESNNYKLFSKNISEQSNIFLYSDLSKAAGTLNNFTSTEISKAYQEKPDAFEKFEAFAYQIKCDGQFFYNSACFTVNSVLEAITKQLWSVDLDTLMSFSPIVVSDKENKAYNILAFDKLNQLYQIDKSGNILRKIKISETPLSAPVEVNYENEKYYVFNTPSYLYLLNSEGAAVSGFPVKLQSKSTAPMTVADYSNNNDYRYLIPCGKQLYNYTKKGAVNTGWSVVECKSEIIKKVNVLNFAGSDCIVITNKDGALIVVDRKGKEKVKIKESFAASVFSKVYVSKMPDSKSKCLLTTDNHGRLVFIDDKGKVEIKNAGNYSASHQFIYEDFNNDGTKDFIYLDSNKLVVFNEKFSSIASVTFPYVIAPDLIVLKNVGKSTIIGAYSISAQKIYVITPDGTIKQGFPLKGDSPFYIESLSKNSDLNLVVGNGKSIINYAFE